MTIRKGSDIIAGCVSDRYTAGDWIDINQNEISANGSTNTNLKENIKFYALIQGNISDGAIFYVDVDITNPYEGQTFTHVNLYVYDNNNLNIYVSSINIVYNNNYFTLAGSTHFYTPSSSYSLSGIEFTSTLQSITMLQHDVQYDGFYNNTSDEVLPTQKAVKTYVDTLDSNAVHKLGDETVNGNKTFQDILKINESIRQTRTDLVKGTLPSGAYYFGLIYDDGSPYPSGQSFNNENRFGLFETSVQANGDVSTYMCAYKNTSNTETASRIGITYPLSGNPYTDAPTPSLTSDYSSKIATTQWVKNSIRGKILANNLSQKTGVITLNESIQNFPILLFGVGAVSSYQYSTCIVTPFAGRLNSYRDFFWQVNGDTIRLNYTNGQTSAASQMITLKITSNVSVEIVTNTGDMEIRGIFGLSFN